MQFTVLVAWAAVIFNLNHQGNFDLASQLRCNPEPGLRARLRQYSRLGKDHERSAVLAPKQLNFMNIIK